MSLLILVWTLYLVKLANMVAYIFSYSFRLGVVPGHWKRSMTSTLVDQLYVLYVIMHYLFSSQLCCH